MVQIKTVLGTRSNKLYVIMLLYQVLWSANYELENLTFKFETNFIIIIIIFLRKSYTPLFICEETYFDYSTVDYNDDTYPSSVLHQIQSFDFAEFIPQPHLSTKFRLISRNFNWKLDVFLRSTSYIIPVH